MAEPWKKYAEKSRAQGDGPWANYQGDANERPMGLLAPGNIDLNHRPVVKNADGSISTVRSISANFDGREVLIPTVSDDGRIMSNREAIDTYLRTGRNLGSFDTPANATAYAESLHSQQARQYTQPDFSNVRSAVRSTEASRKPDFSNVRSATRSTEAETAKPSLFRMDSDFRDRSGAGVLDMLVASAKDMFGSRKGAGDYLAEQYNRAHGLSSQINGGAHMSQDTDGAPVLALPDGSRYRLNDKGLDAADIANVTGNIVAMMSPAGWAGRFAQARNIGLLGRMGIQGATSAAGEAGLMGLFNDGEVDPMRVGLAGMGGIGGELLGSGLGLAANNGSAIARALLGRNAGEAEKIVVSQGAKPTPELVRKVAPNVPQVQAGADPRAIVGEGQYGFRYSLGQRLTDPKRKFEQLSREEVLRQNAHGHAAFDEMGRHNSERLGNVLDAYGEQFGSRVAATPAELVQGSASGLRRQAADLDSRIAAAYTEAGKGNRMAVGSDAVASMPDRLKLAVRDFDVNPDTTPAANRALIQLRQATDGILTGPQGGGVRGVTLRALETQRRILGMGIDAAKNPTDRAAMVAIKREFDGWLDDAVEKALVSGDKGALESLRNARALRAEYGRRFEGGAESDKFIQGLLDGTRTPEELLNVALGASQVSKAGASRFIERLKVAANNDPEVMGGLRTAHFMRLTRGADGKPADLGQIVNNIRKTEYTNGSAVRALYSPQQWAEIRLLANSLEPMIAKGDFARSSGSIERLWRGLMDKMAGGKLSGIWGMATTGLKGVQAQRAIKAPVRPAAPGGEWAAAPGAAYWNEQGR